MPFALSTSPSLLSSANALESDVFNASGSPAKLTSSNFNVAAAEKGPSRREIKKERETRWKAWCRERRWSEEDDPMYKQKAGASEVHRSDGMFSFELCPHHPTRGAQRSIPTAMTYFRLKDYEIDTLPHVEFENIHNPNTPGRSYNRGNLCTLVSRKFAMLGGVDSEIDPKTREDEFLRRGWTLFQEKWVPPLLSIPYSRISFLLPLSVHASLRSVPRRAESRASRCTSGRSSSVVFRARHLSSATSSLGLLGRGQPQSMWTACSWVGG